MRTSTLLPIVGLVSLAGCVEYEYASFEGVDVFYQDPPSEVDILMVVDNSCSMDPYQEKLAENFQEFISFFIDANVDYQIGVVTTTVAEAVPVPENGCSQSDVDAIPAGGHLVGGAFITEDTPDAEEKFSDYVNLGICGSGYEMGLESAYRAVTDPDALADNGKFLRDDASLSIIFVANEEDYSPLGVNDYINTFRDVKGQRSRDVFNASALVVQNLDDCTQREINAGASEGSRYLDVAKQTNGIRASICDDDFESIVTDLSLNTSRLNDTFYLSSLPAVGSLTVTVDETDMPCEDGGWSYTLTTNEADEPVGAVTFDRDAIPAPGSQVTIRYNEGDGAEDSFCSGEGA